MDDRISQPAVHELPPTARGVVSPGDPAMPGLADPRALTILTTEHWSLLSARALVYNEAFARSGMFLSFLSASLVALGLIATGAGFSTEFLAVSAIVLAVDLFVGIVTLGRVAASSNEDLRCIQGMNRLRHAYHEIVPGLEPYFITQRYDDVMSVLGSYGPDPNPAFGPAAIVHGTTTTPGMLAVINSALAGVLGGVIAILVAGPSNAALVVALAVFAVAFAANVVGMIRSVRLAASTIVPAFPRPPSGL